MRLIIFGPQGAGKGTQGARLSEKYDIPDISTGDIFRWAIRGGTALGHKVRDYVQKGRFVPDDLTIEVVMERLSADDAKDGFLIDGYPRNIDQAQALEDFLEERDTALDAALVIDVPEEVSLRRLLGRRVCTKCGRNYHVDDPPRSDWTCDRCGGHVEPRIDDGEEETIRGRLRLYQEQTEPLKDFYREKGLLEEGDIISLDVGVHLDGFHADSAWTFPVGAIDAEVAELLKVTEASLEAAVAQCKPRLRLGDVGYAVEQTAEAAGFSIVREYVGHGVGRALHEDPQIPNYGPPGRREILGAGMTLAIEPMVNAGGPRTRVLSDGWTVVTADGSLSAHFEHTVAVTPGDPDVLTRREPR